MDSLSAEPNSIHRGDDFWHPSGRIPVYDAGMSLVGSTSLKIAFEAVWLSRVVRNQSSVVGEVRRVLVEHADRAPYWAYWVCAGDPADIPGFFAPDFHAVGHSPHAHFGAVLIRPVSFDQPTRAGL